MQSVQKLLAAFIIIIIFVIVSLVGSASFQALHLGRALQPGGQAGRSAGQVCSERAVMFPVTNSHSMGPHVGLWRDAHVHRWPPGLIPLSRLSCSSQPIVRVPCAGPLCAPPTLHSPGAPLSLTPPPEGLILQPIPPGLLSCCSQPLSRWWIFPSHRSPLLPSSPGSAQYNSSMSRDFPSSS